MTIDKLESAEDTLLIACKPEKEMDLFIYIFGALFLWIAYLWSDILTDPWQSWDSMGDWLFNLLLPFGSLYLFLNSLFGQVSYREIEVTRHNFSATNKPLKIFKNKMNIPLKDIKAFYIKSVELSKTEVIYYLKADIGERINIVIHSSHIDDLTKLQLLLNEFTGIKKLERIG
jgi:hypothetical protein